MRNKFLGTGDAGYHPVRKIRTVFAGLRYAVLYDFSVAYKLVLSVAVLAATFMLREWLDFLLILVVTGLVLIAEIFNSAVEALCDFVETRHNANGGLGPGLGCDSEGRGRMAATARAHDLARRGG